MSFDALFRLLYMHAFESFLCSRMDPFLEFVLVIAGRSDNYFSVVACFCHASSALCVMMAIQPLFCGPDL